MFESVKAGAPGFTAAGQSLESFAALTGVMANAGVKGSAAGTNLRNVMLRLADPSAEAAGILEQLGVTTKDSEGNFRDIIDIVADFEKGLVGMGSAEKTAALSTVFGAKSVTGFNIMLAEGSDALRDYREDLINSEGAATSMAEAIRNSVGNRIKVLKSGLTELGLQFVEAFETQGRGALDMLITAVQNFDMAKVTDAINKAVDLFKWMFNFIQQNQGAIKGLIITLGSFKAAVLLVNGALAIQQGFMAVGPVFGFIKAIASLAKTEGILKTVQLALNMAMSANPIGLAVAAVAALVAGIVLLIKKWKEFKEDFSGASFGDFVNPFSSERKERRAERRASRRGETETADGSMDGMYGGDSYAGGMYNEAMYNQTQGAMMQEKMKETERIKEEQRTRHDIYLTGPVGMGISETPGGAPESAMQLGVQ